MAEWPGLPAGYDLPLVNSSTKRLPDPTMDAIEQALIPTFVGVARDTADSFQDVERRTQFIDVSDAKGALVNIEHFGDGTGPSNPADQGETFGLDIHNNPGANASLVIHQYSDAQEAMRIDNTDSAPALVIKNTFNQNRNPDGAAENTSATGEFLSLRGYNNTPWFRVLGRGELYLTPPADATAHAIEVVGNAGSTKNCIRITSNAAAPAMQITMNAGAAGQYAMLISGYNYGPNISTSQNGGDTLRITKSGTGNGQAVVVINQGTGPTVSYRTASSTTVASINANGEYEHQVAGAGIILKSPDGTRYRVTVANGGTLAVSAA